MKRTIETALLLSAACLLVSAHGCRPADGECVNLALNHPSWHSSAVDYDHTAQLLTDGIVDDSTPTYYTVTVNGAPLAKQQLAHIFDYRKSNGISFKSGSLDLEFAMSGFGIPADEMTINAAAYPAGKVSGMSVSVSENGSDWVEVPCSVTPSAKGESLKCTARFPERMNVSACRIKSAGEGVSTWKVASIHLLDAGEEQDVFKAIRFSSCWISGGTRNEWAYVDLAAKSRLSRVVMHWTEPVASGEILVSDDAANWRRAAGFKGAENHMTDTVKINVSARYVKVAVDSTLSGGRIGMKEMEVFGVPSANAAQKAAEPGTDEWKVARADRVSDPAAWIPATVPGTVLSSYVDAGVVPDPAWGDDISMISDSYFRSDFVYRGVMYAPEHRAGRTWLVFDGINWKADVTFNGASLGTIEGNIKRAKYDVTDMLKDGGNDVEVLVRCNDNPGLVKGQTLAKGARNGGVLGFDNPTFHASIGWDWIPSVPGRNIGIWNDVHFAESGDVTIEDPFVNPSLDLPDTTKAVLAVSALLRNHSAEPVEAVLKGRYGDLDFEKAVSLPPYGSSPVELSLTLENPHLWWPNGYGEPYLYEVSMSALAGGEPSDSVSFKSGVRQMTYALENGRLKGWINGRRFNGRGGNWGFSEFNLRYREKDYDRAVRLHRDQNFTMIRNWVCQILDDEFFDACDRYGIMIWQDFCLANPADGPDPSDHELFDSSADELIRRVRNHPSIAIYVGRNEGLPPHDIDEFLRSRVASLHPGLYYIPDSAGGEVGGHGRYCRMSTLDFFKIWDTDPKTWGSDRFHSEKGMPNVPEYRSLEKFIPSDHMWPQDDVWAAHNWVIEGAQYVNTFNDAIESMFGAPADAKQFCEWAQWVNYDGYRAMFESRSDTRRGLLLWMSHPAWPSMVWCTYDYYLDPTAAFFGSKKACEPLHIMWNPLKAEVEVVNLSAGDRHALNACAEVLDMWGRVISEKKLSIDSPEDSTVGCFSLDTPDEDVWYYSLKLYDGETLVSRNFYVQGRNTDDFKALKSLPKADVKLSCGTSMSGDGIVVACKLENCGKAPAMMLRLTALESKGGERVLPVHWSDNYIHLMPGETRTVTLEVADEDCGGHAPYVELSGFNL